MHRYQFAPGPEDDFPFNVRPRKNTALPTMLSIETSFTLDDTNLQELCELEPFVALVVQITELRPILILLLRAVRQVRLHSCSSTTWSFVENSNFVLSILTDRFGSLRDDNAPCSVDLNVEERKVLKDCVGQVVNLGHGDVAVEVAFKGILDGEEVEINSYEVDTISYIFGGYGKTAYVPVSKTSSVFYLGRISSGTTDFSVLRNFMKHCKYFPTFEKMDFCTKYTNVINDDD